MEDPLKIHVWPTFGGIVVVVERGPSADDPLAQRGTSIKPFKTLDEALNSLPALAREELERRGKI